MSSQSTLLSSGSNDEENTFHSSSNNNEENGCLESKGLRVEGKIYGKTDFGYLVYFKVGSDVCNGVIYRPKEQAPSRNAIGKQPLPPKVGVKVYKKYAKKDKERH
nr:uncharacterized protein LOC104645220 isoform X2 [Solanum lycopersicum]